MEIVMRVNLWKASTLALAGALALVTTIGTPSSTGTNTVSLVRDANAEQQPEMKAALDALIQAQAHLEKAITDKGGYRAKALEQVSKAIADVKAGIDYANSH
jgi:hypothetical protein